MKKLFCFTYLVALFLFSSFILTPKEVVSENVNSKSLKSMVTIYSYYSNKSGETTATRGKGVVYFSNISHSYVVTAAHVVQQGILGDHNKWLLYRYSIVYFSDGIHREGYLTKEDDTRDVASLDVPYAGNESASEVAPISLGDTYFGFNFIINYWEDRISEPISFSFLNIFLPHSIIAKNVSGNNIILTGEIPFYIPGGIREGSSGSGIFNGKGEVVGIISASNSFFGEFAPIYEFLKET